MKKRDKVTFVSKPDANDVQKRMSRLFCPVCRRVTPHNFLGCTQHVDEPVGENKDDTVQD